MEQTKATEIAKEQTKAPTKRQKKSKVGKFYNKVQYLNSAKDQDQTTTFDLKGEKKVLGKISLPESTARILNRQTKWSGIAYEETK
jgi:hypothetical protein